MANKKLVRVDLRPEWAGSSEAREYRQILQVQNLFRGFRNFPSPPAMTDEPDRAVPKVLKLIPEEGDFVRLPQAAVRVVALPKSSFRATRSKFNSKRWGSFFDHELRFEHTPGNHFGVSFIVFPAEGEAKKRKFAPLDSALAGDPGYGPWSQKNLVTGAIGYVNVMILHDKGRRRTAVFRLVRQRSAVRKLRAKERRDFEGWAEHVLPFIESRLASNGIRRFAITTGGFGDKRDELRANEAAEKLGYGKAGFHRFFDPAYKPQAPKGRKKRAQLGLNFILQHRIKVVEPGRR